MTQLTAQQLDEIQARADAATPGPWHLTDADTIVAPLTADEIADVWEPTQASRNGEFIENARTDVPALLNEVRRLRAELRIGTLWKCNVCGKDNHRDVCLICETDRPDPEPAEEQPAEACGKCKTPFDPSDTRFDGHARYYLTPFCKRCVDACHDNEIADHRCVICA